MAFGRVELDLNLDFSIKAVFPLYPFSEQPPRVESEQRGTNAEGGAAARIQADTTSARLRGGCRASEPGQILDLS